MRGHPSNKPVRNPSRLLVTFTFALAACGGKIAGDERASSGKDPSGDPTSGSGLDPAPASSGTQQPSSPFAPFTAPPSGLPQPSGGRTVDDACGAICERNGECGATQTDCKDSCADEIRGAASCSAQANAYIQCYADNLLPGCAALPPVCEGDYCAYTICAGKVVPRYCH
jgi:hypothetical protein